MKMHIWVLTVCQVCRPSPIHAASALTCTGWEIDYSDVTTFCTPAPKRSYVLISWRSPLHTSYPLPSSPPPMAIVHLGARAPKTWSYMINSRYHAKMFKFLTILAFLEFSLSKMPNIWTDMAQLAYGLGIYSNLTWVPTMGMTTFFQKLGSFYTCQKIERVQQRVFE